MIGSAVLLGNKSHNFRYVARLDSIATLPSEGHSCAASHERLKIERTEKLSQISWRRQGASHAQGRIQPVRQCRRLILNFRSEGIECSRERRRLRNSIVCIYK
ncbi:hypothetical protein D3C87_1276940 [compost metagenome]